MAKDRLGRDLAVGDRVLVPMPDSPGYWRGDITAIDGDMVTVWIVDEQSVIFITCHGDEVERLN